MSREGHSGEAIKISTSIVALLFLVEFLDYLSPLNLDAFGIVPRTVRGLPGILFSPLLHYNSAHLLANAFPLFVLLTLLFLDRGYHPDRTLGIIWLASGFGTWLIGRGGALERGDTVHIGASSVIYGLVVYLIASGWWVRSWRSAVVAVLVLIFYGGIFHGLLPQRGPVSWEGHLSGAIAGWFAARWTHR